MTSFQTDRPEVDEQVAYYRARAPEYDEWFLRRVVTTRDQSRTQPGFGRLRRFSMRSPRLLREGRCRARLRDWLVDRATP